MTTNQTTPDPRAAYSKRRANRIMVTIAVTGTVTLPLLAIPAARAAESDGGRFMFWVLHLIGLR